MSKSIYYLGKPYEGKPHVRFDEGSRETEPKSYCVLDLLYNRAKRSIILAQSRFGVADKIKLAKRVFILTQSVFTGILTK